MTDKSNALTYGHELWQRVYKIVKAEYPEIEATHQYIDNLLMQMVRDPRQFDVIVTTNLFGDIASDLGAQLAGGSASPPRAIFIQVRYRFSSPSTAPPPPSPAKISRIRWARCSPSP